MRWNRRICSRRGERLPCWTVRMEQSRPRLHIQVTESYNHFPHSHFPKKYWQGGKREKICIIRSSDTYITLPQDKRTKIPGMGSFMEKYKDDGKMSRILPSSISWKTQPNPLENLSCTKYTKKILLLFLTKTYCCRWSFQQHIPVPENNSLNPQFSKQSVQ